MSVEEAVTEGLNSPAAGGAANDKNAQAAEDAQKMLDELSGETTITSGDKDGDKKTDDATEATDKSEGKDTRNGGSGGDRRDRRDNNNNNNHRGRGGGGGRGRGGAFKKRSDRENIKSDLTTQEVTDDPVAIRKQVEFYFSDSNLPMDKFLLGKVGGHKNFPVELSVIHSFKRMRHFQPFEAIVEALKDSTILELVDDETAVKRREPLPEELEGGNLAKVIEDKAMPRSVYVKGFGEEAPSTQFDIEAFFAPYGPTNAIRLRRTEDKIFKRSVFVEFESEELAQKFLAQDPKPQFNGKDLLIMSKKEYCDKKVDDINAGRIRPNSSRGKGRSGGFSGRGRGGRDRDFKRKRDNEDDRDWRERRDEDRKNGFSDDKRRSGRDRGGRERREQKDAEVDESGIPKIKTTEEGDGKVKRDNAKADAIAQARAAVEKDKQAEQGTADNVESADADGKDAQSKAADTVAQSVKDDIKATSKKRAREDDEADASRDTKEADTKADA